MIDELRPALWVNSDRPGMQFLAEVTLPRTRDPRTGKPLTTYISGSNYTTPGRWQQLEITDFPRALQHQVFVLRSQLSLIVDSHEAFVSRVLLNVYGGPGVTNVWTDDLEVIRTRAVEWRQHGRARRRAGRTAQRRRGGLAGPAPNASVPATGPVAAPPDPLRREVKLAGSVLKVNEYPIFPRAVEYRGERLAYSQAVGLQHDLAAGRSLRGSSFGKLAYLDSGSSRRRPKWLPARRKARSVRNSSPCSPGTWATV